MRKGCASYSERETHQAPAIIPRDEERSHLGKLA